MRPVVAPAGRTRNEFALGLRPFVTFLSADLPSQTPSSFNLSKPLRGDLTPPAPLSNFAATPLVERGEPERACFLAPPSPRSEAELERGAGGVRSLGRSAFRDVISAQLALRPRDGAFMEIV